MNVQAALCVLAVSKAVAVIVLVPTGIFCNVCTDVVEGNVPRLTAEPVVGFVEVYVTLVAPVKPFTVGLL